MCVCEYRKKNPHPEKIVIPNLYNLSKLVLRGYISCKGSEMFSQSMHKILFYKLTEWSLL